MHPAPPQGVPQRGVQVVQQGTHSLLLVGGKLFKFIPNPTFDPIIVAGCMDLMFRGQIPEGVDPRSLMKLEPLRAEYQDRDARMAVMDEQGLEAVVLFPTLAVGIEQMLRDDIEATDGRAPRVQPVARRGLGLRAPGPHLRRADALARRSRCRDRRARVGARPRRAHGAPATRRPSPPPTARAARSATPTTTRCGRASPRPTCRSRSTSATAATRCSPAPGRARDWFEPFRGGVDVLSKLVVSDRPIHDTHRQHGDRRRVRPAPEAPRREHRERLRLGRACW